MLVEGGIVIVAMGVCAGRLGGMGVFNRAEKKNSAVTALDPVAHLQFRAPPLQSVSRRLLESRPTTTTTIKHRTPRDSGLLS